LSISRTILQSSAQYARAYLHTEYDDNDLTYFIIYQIKTLELAFKSFKKYISRKIKEKQQLYNFRKIKNLNERQLYILKWLHDNPKTTFTIKEIQNRFNVVYETARNDLMQLKDKKLLQKTISGKKKQIYYRADNFDRVLRDLMK